MTADSYLGRIKVEIEGAEDKVSNLEQNDKLYAVVQVLEKLKGQLNCENVAYKGTIEFKPFMVKDTFNDKTLNIVNDGTTDKEFGIAQSDTTNQALHLDLSGKDWFAFNENYGTSEEKYWVKYLDKMIDALKLKYDEVYLLRNEKHFQLYNFDDGRAFEPDFVLFLVNGTETPALYYQVFIEPKGQPYIKQDEWKNNFLIKLKAEHKIEQLWKDKKYIVWGMPFYNETETRPEFEKAFNELI